MKKYLLLLTAITTICSAQQFDGPPIKEVESGRTLPATTCVVLANTVPGAVHYFLPKAPVG